MTEQDATIKVSPERFLEMLCRRHQTGKTGGKTIVVEGSVDLSSFSRHDQISEIPECSIEGNLTATGCRTLTGARCSVKGDALLSGSGVSFLGGGFQVGGSLDVGGCALLRTVSGRVGGNAIFDLSGVVSLGRDFFCGGELSVRGCAFLEKLDCEVKRGLVASDSSLSELGENFCCEGSLVLDGCGGFQTLGPLRKPPHDVYLGNSGIRKVRPSFECTGDILLNGVPELSSAGGTIGGSAHISDSPALRFVDGLQVGRGLAIHNCPNLRKVSFSGKGNAVLNNCGMGELLHPRGWTGTLSVRNSPAIHTVGGTWSGGVTLHSLPSLRQISPDFRCGGDLEVSECEQLGGVSGEILGGATFKKVGKLEFLGKDLKIGGNLILCGGGVGVKTVGCPVGGASHFEDTKFLEETQGTFSSGGSLTVKNCPGFGTARGRVEGDALFQGTGPVTLGADFECSGNLSILRCSEVRTLNCAVGGGVDIKESTVDKIGPAFRHVGALRLVNAEVRDDRSRGGRDGEEETAEGLVSAPLPKGTPGICRESATRREDKRHGAGGR